LRLAGAIVGKQPGAPVDIALARTLYVRACDELRDASGCLALASAHGTGVFPDTGKDLALAATYAERGCTLAPDTHCHPHAQMLIDGEGVPPDKGRGRAMLERSCDNRYLAACDLMYRNLRWKKLEPQSGGEASYYLAKVCAPGMTDLCARCTPPEPTPPSKAVPLQSLGKLRVAGDMEIHLPRRVLEDAAARNIRKLDAMVRLCASAAGDVSCVMFYKKTGYDLADTHLLSEISEWRFHPYLIDGKPVPVCAPFLFKYEIGP
jgi:TPR repeat protein